MLLDFADTQAAVTVLHIVPHDVIGSPASRRIFAGIGRDRELQQSQSEHPLRRRARLAKAPQLVDGIPVWCFECYYVCR